jgi:hypothetical protein
MKLTGFSYLVLPISAAIALGLVQTKPISEDLEIAEFNLDYDRVFDIVDTQQYDSNQITLIGHNAAQLGADATVENIEFHIVVMDSDKVDATNLEQLRQMQKPGYHYASYNTTAGNEVQNTKQLAYDYDGDKDYSQHIDNPLVQAADRMVGKLVFGDGILAKHTKVDTNEVILVGGTGSRTIVSFTDDAYRALPKAYSDDTDVSDSYAKSGWVQIGIDGNDAAYAKSEDIFAFVTGQRDDLEWDRTQIGDGTAKAKQLSNTVSGNLVLSVETPEGSLTGIPMKLDGNGITLDFQAAISALPFAPVRLSSQDNKATVMGVDDGNLVFLRTATQSGAEEVSQGSDNKLDVDTSTGWPALQAWTNQVSQPRMSA